MVIGVHALIFSADPDADRAFLRDVLGFPYVDDGDGWLIFKLPPSEVGVHPSDGANRHELYLMVDDLTQTVADLTSKGVEIVDEPTARGYGVEVTIRMPSGATLGIYEPRHRLAIDL
jgi:catechol 2,3-dioxygenase-like lactoylglutathione lyase family enzyme